MLLQGMNRHTVTAADLDFGSAVLEGFYGNNTFLYSVYKLKIHGGKKALL